MTLETKQRLWRTLLAAALGELSQFDHDLDNLFVNHTYLSIVVALILQARFGIDTTSLAESDPADLLRGQRFRNETGVHGVIEPDFFAWPAEVGGESVIKDIALRVARFDWRQAPPDIAAILYETVIPADQRRQLGEYYTPHWLARSIVRETVSNPLEQRVLDPACGSGTFIAEAVSYFIDHARRANLPPRETLDKLIHSVTGVDVHPVAVHLARSAWILAAKPAIDDAVASGADASLSVPVYLGDSLLLRFPGFRPGDMIAGNEVRIPIEDNDNDRIIPRNDNADLLFPRSLVERAGDFDLLMTETAHAIENGDDSAPILNRSKLDPNERSVMEQTIAAMQRLHDEGRNHIWAYYARNLVRPLILARSRVDVIVGNPPWLNYRNTASVLRSELERQSKNEYNIWTGGRYATHQDVAGLFYARSVDLYLKDNGVIAMVMPHSSLQAGQYAKWRSGDWRSTTGGRGRARSLAVRFSWKTPWDLETLTPNDFFPVPASVVFAQRAGENAQASPLPPQVERWFGKPGAPDIRRETAPITGASAAGVSPYAVHSSQGAIIVPRRFFFVGEIESPAAVQAVPLITVKPRVSAQDKEPWRSLNLAAITETSIERTHLFNVHLGETITPYTTLPPLKALLPLKQGDSEINVNALEPRMQDRWRKINALWKDHKAAANTLNLLGQIDYYGKLSAQLNWRRFPSGRPVRIAYSSSGKPTAALLDDNDAIVDSSLFWVACRSINEANYLLATINSRTLYEAVAPLMSKGQFGARSLQKHIWKLPIPEFDAHNSLHTEIAAAGAAAAEGAASLLNRLRAQRSYFAATRHPLTVTIARRELRNWLAESPEGRNVEAAIKRLLP